MYVFRAKVRYSRSATADFNLKQEVLPVQVLMFVVFSLFCTVTLTCYIFCTIYFYVNFSLPIELTSYFPCTELKIYKNNQKLKTHTINSKVKCFFVVLTYLYTKQYKSSSQDIYPSQLRGSIKQPLRVL